MHQVAEHEEDESQQGESQEDEDPPHDRKHQGLLALLYERKATAGAPGLGVMALVLFVFVVVMRG